MSQFSFKWITILQVLLEFTSTAAIFQSSLISDMLGIAWDELDATILNDKIEEAYVKIERYY